MGLIIYRLANEIEQAIESFDGYSEGGKSMNDNKFVSKQARLIYLDLYKGICILFIIITHYKWEDIQRRYLLFPFWIEMAVPVFMVITGYLSTMSLDNKSDICVKQLYHPKNIASKWLRFVIPFMPVFVLQVIVKCLRSSVEWGG